MKVLDKTLLKTYVGPFILTFLVVLFVFLMQFLWKYIDDMAGKGLEWYLILKLFFYMSFTFIPLSMPLGVLLSALITFGNLGEKNELTAMKSAGIPLYRIMQPLLVFAVLLSVLTFFIANNGVPVASLKAYTLLRDIQSQKPALNIEEGIFYRGFEDHVIRIGKKDRDNQTIYDVMLYDHSRNTGYTTLTYAQRGKMVMSADKRFLVFTLEDGAVYDENIRYEGSIPPAKLEILRGSFKKEMVRLDLSSFKLQRTSEDFYKDSYEMLNVSQLKKQIDTFKMTIYEERQRYGANIAKNFNSISLCYIDSLAKDTTKKLAKAVPPTDKKQQYTYALQAAREHTSMLEYNQMDNASREKTLWRYEIEWHRKYAIAVACILLFFIGAPLGSIIRKGGLGVPMFLSILIFVIYWILSTMGERMARIGVLEPWVGMWASTLILLPFSLFLIYKASVEAKLSGSAVFSMKMFRKITENTKTITENNENYPIYYEDEEEKFKQLDTDKLIDIVKNYRQYGYDDDLRHRAISILEDRGISKKELELAGGFANRAYDFASGLYKSFRKNSTIAFVSYSITILVPILYPILLTYSEILAFFVMILGFVSLVLYFIFLLKSFFNQNNFYKAIGQDYGAEGALVYLFLGMPFYFVMYFYFRTQMKEKMKEIR